MSAPQFEEGTTLDRFLMETMRATPGATGHFVNLCQSVALAGKMISARVNRAGLAGLLGETGEVNIQGEFVQKLDRYANDTFIRALEHRGHTAMVVSEEEAEPVLVPLVPPVGLGDDGAAVLVAPRVVAPQRPLDGERRGVDGHDALALRVDGQRNGALRVEDAGGDCYGQEERPRAPPHECQPLQLFMHRRTCRTSRTSSSSASRRPSGREPNCVGCGQRFVRGTRS